MVLTMLRGHRTFRLAPAIALLLAASAACGSGAVTNDPSAASPPTTHAPVATTTPAATGSSTPGGGATTSTAPGTTAPTAGATTSAAQAPETIVNRWTGAVVDPARLPIGDARVSTAGASVGGLFACTAGNPNAGGASADGPWLDTAAGTWDSTSKLAVEGSVTWESATYTETVSGGQRVLTSNDLPVKDPTGTFPIARDDPSYAYDRNPGTIAAQAITVLLPEMGVVAAAPTCLREGPVAMLRNGVVAFSSLDARNEDAVAHESQDLCNGHPARTTYHYHSVPVCIRNAATGPSTVVGWAYDGFPIVVERDASGALPTNADLDECHGRTSPVLLDGAIVTVYHYSATLEFPYFMGCYRGTKAV